MNKEIAHNTTTHWQTLEQAIEQAGSPDRIAHQKEQGKLAARQRISLLLDNDSFVEFDRLACSLTYAQKLYSDGVITGLGTIDGRPVAVYAQDFTIKGGSLGKRHAEKICKIMDHAAKIGCPIIGIIDSGGARIDEGVHALAGYGQIFQRNCKYSGVIPQISIIAGPCAGGAVYSPALTDFVFMTEAISQMFITGPQVIADVLHQTITKDELGGATVHGQKSGVAHVICQTEENCFEQVKSLLSYLPRSYADDAPVKKLRDIPEQIFNPMLVPTDFSQSYDMNTLIDALTDGGSFFQIQPWFAQNMIIGFARFDGRCVGIIANQPLCKAGTIDIDASCKAARFIQFCDAFSIPLVTLVDTPGYLPGIDQEHGGIIRHGAKLLYAYATATVPKITIIIRKAFGGAYIVMGSKELGADVNCAWPQAHIAVLGAKAAVSILHAKKLAGLDTNTRKTTTEQLEHDYQEKYLNPFVAAESGYIDAIISPEQTRSTIIKSLALFEDKIEKMPLRKHGNVPL